MKFYEKLILKDVSEFQKLTQEQKRINVELYKHKYIAMWLSSLFAITFYPEIILVSLTIITLIIFNFVNTTLGIVIFIVTLPYNLFVSAIVIWAFYRTCIKKGDLNEVRNKLFELFTKPWLYNYKVISRKDWRRIKQVNPQFYQALRGEGTNHKCYHTCYKLLKLMHNSEVKMAWIYVEALDMKCGHAILIKGDYVYDSNMRRTYDKETYFKLLKVEVFWEFMHNECRSYNELLTSEVWQAFGIWCRQLGGKRYTDDEQG